MKINGVHRALLLLLVSFILPNILYSQCAMCRAVLESEGDTDRAQGLNNGILFLMVIPYLLAAGVGYAIYRIRKK